MPTWLPDPDTMPVRDDYLPKYVKQYDRDYFGLINDLPDYEEEDEEDLYADWDCDIEEVFG